jgi:hypothetical protein
MQTITLPRPWTYRTPQTTIDYPAGEHAVFKYVADAAENEGALGEEPATVPGPLDQSVPELESYLDGVDDLGEIVALIDAEEKGKTRKGALDALRARKAALEA